jgi:hypothetical protein
MTLRPHRLLGGIALALLILFLLLSGRCRGEERKNDPAAEVVSFMLKAYGGPEAIRQVVSITAKGQITEFLSGKSGEYARYFQRSRKLRIEVMPEQGGEIRILNGDRGWQKSREGYIPVSQLELQSMLYQYSYLNLPMGLVTRSYRVKYGGKQLYEGQTVYLLQIEPKDAPRLGILVDAKSGLIVRVDASFAMGTMGTGELSTEYSDFHPEAGVLFPHKLTSFAGGIKLSEIVLTKITVNEKMPPELFTP